MAWVALGAAILGVVLLKAILDPETKIYRCPNCNLVIKPNRRNCPRCKINLKWA